MYYIRILVLKVVRSPDIVWECPLLNWHRIIRTFLMAYVIFTIEFQLMIEYDWFSTLVQTVSVIRRETFYPIRLTDI